MRILLDSLFALLAAYGLLALLLPAFERLSARRVSRTSARKEPCRKKRRSAP